MPDMQRDPTVINAAAPFGPRAVFSDIYPLNEFYAARNTPLPAIGHVQANEIPEPYRSLLVHNSDMTSKLQAFHKDAIHIQPLARHNTDNEYFREVVLVLEKAQKPVEFGAIKIILDLFSNDAQQEILKAHRPLGQVLTEYKIAFSSRPRAFLRVTADSFIQASLNLEGEAFLYGRRNTLVDAWDRPLAEIVVILPP
jgi:chorismate-pyruvate lyase